MEELLYVIESFDTLFNVSVCIHLSELEKTKTPEELSRDISKCVILMGYKGEPSI